MSKVRPAVQILKLKLKLEVEIPMFRQLFKNSSVLCFTDVVDDLQNLTDERCLIPNVMIIIYILMVIPATSATPERSFRSLAELKPGNEQPCPNEGSIL